MAPGQEKGIFSPPFQCPELVPAAGAEGGEVWPREGRCKLLKWKRWRLRIAVPGVGSTGYTGREGWEWKERLF